METITLQKGAQETAHIEQPATSELPPIDTVQTVGAVALSTECGKATVGAHRHGYRQDSPPEVIDLLRQAQAGETSSFAQLYQTHVDRITRYVAARMRHRDRDAIPDLVQEAFCEAFANLPTAHHDVTGWFLAHAAKACTRHAWSNRRYLRAAMTVREETRAAEANGHTHEIERPIAVGHVTLVHALSRLVPDQRRALQLRFLDGLPRQNRAEELDRSLEALKALEWRALRNLRISFRAAEVA